MAPTLILHPKHMKRILLILLITLNMIPQMRGEKFEFSPNRERVLRNPLSGWVLYLGRSWDENFWVDKGYDDMITSTGEEVKVSDYASCAYLRISWAALEPTEGDYIWNNPNARITRMLESARKRGLRLAFRIVVDGRDQGQNTPQYVFDAGAEGYYDPSAPGKNHSPYPDDPVFQEKFAKFFRAFASRFDNADEVEFIDGFSLGKWGEAHTMIYKNKANKEKVFFWMTNLCKECFKHVPTFVHYHRMLADTNGWGTPAAESEYLIESAIENGFSLRHDAFGMTGYYQGWEKNLASSWKFKRPIIMEGGWITGGTHRYWIDPSGEYREGHPEDVRLGEYNAAREAHVNMMDLRVNDEVATWFGRCFPLVKQFIAEGGYRLYPSSAETNFSESTLSVTTEWENIGWGYCPTNLPQWNQKYKVGIAIINNSGEPVRITAEQSSDLSQWIKGQKFSYTTELSTSGLPGGKYNVGIALIDTSNGNKPTLEMALDSELIAESGWVSVGNFEISQPTQPEPDPNPEPDPKPNPDPEPNPNPDPNPDQPSEPQEGKIIYVSPTGAGSCDGSSMENALDIDHWQVAALNNESGAKYILAPGVYYLKECIVYRKGTSATIIGSSSSENRTILSGDINRDGIASVGDLQRLLKFQTDTREGDDSKKVTISNIDFTCVCTQIDADPVADIAPFGVEGVGALYLDNCGSTLISNCRFYNTCANKKLGGSGLHIRRSQALIEDCLFFENSGTSRGGAIRITSTDGSKGNVTINRSAFHNNSVDGEYGGAIFMSHGAALNLLNSTFYNNHSLAKGGAIFTNSSAAHPCRLRIANCTISGNSTTNVDGQITSTQLADIEIFNSIILSNTESTSDIYYLK